MALIQAPLVPVAGLDSEEDADDDDEEIDRDREPILVRDMLANSTKNHGCPHADLRDGKIHVLTDTGS